MDTTALDRAANAYLRQKEAAAVTATILGMTYLHHYRQQRNFHQT
jgi:hypothetical protein